MCHPGKRYPSESKGLQPEEKRRLKGLERVGENRGSVGVRGEQVGVDLGGGGIRI